MPTLIFSAIVALLQNALDLVEKIGNQLFSRLERVRPTLVGFVAMPVIEGGLPFGILAAAPRDEHCRNPSTAGHPVHGRSASTKCREAARTSLRSAGP